MRMKVVLIISSLCLLLTFVLLERYIVSTEYNAVDLLEVNDTYKNIENALETESIDEVEDQYSCRIVLRSDTDYGNTLNNALRNGDACIDYLEGDKLIGKIIFPSNSNSFRQLKRNLSIALWAVFGAILIILYLAAFFIDRRIIRPFRLLERFADNISVGNLDIPLTMDRSNYFGAFTESFDMMREELKKAKQGEYEANVSKKELVAGLSHDIKTPVSTIKALCEILEIKLTEDELVAKIHTINQKADVIDNLISNMFHATLEELTALKIEPREELSTVILPMFADINHFGRIHMKNDIPGCLVYCDKLRLNQVIDNVINNSYKYAGTAIDVNFQEKEEHITIEIRDYGNSITEGDIPLVFEKFYRGENASSSAGSGLGLYLSKQFMEGMQGGIECYEDHGFVVVLSLRKV